MEFHDILFTLRYVLQEFIFNKTKIESKRRHEIDKSDAAQS